MLYYYTASVDVNVDDIIDDKQLNEESSRNDVYDGVEEYLAEFFNDDVALEISSEVTDDICSQLNIHRE